MDFSSFLIKSGYNGPLAFTELQGCSVCLSRSFQALLFCLVLPFLLPCALTRHKTVLLSECLLYLMPRALVLFQGIRSYLFGAVFSSSRMWWLIINQRRHARSPKPNKMREEGESLAFVAGLGG